MASDIIERWKASV